MSEPLGVVLAGGRGSRLGCQKAMASLAGRPLIAYPVEAMRAAASEVVVVAKASSRLPELPGVRVHLEPPEPRHPLVGMREALALAGEQPVLVCAVDLPLVDAGLLRALASADPGGAPALVAASGGELQPLLGCYQSRALELLPESGALRQAVAVIGARTFEVPDARALFNVNTPEDLARAEVLLAHAQGPNPPGSGAETGELHA